MKLGLVETKVEKKEVFFANADEVRFNFLKNMIKKDLELAYWCNNVVKVFGEFEIYSDHQAEMNSFDYIISHLSGKNVDFADDSLEAYISCKCPEYFFKLLIFDDFQFKKGDLDILAIKFTNYLLEATQIIITITGTKAIKELFDLEKKYLRGQHMTSWNYFN